MPATVEKHAVVEDEAARAFKVKYHFDLCKYKDMRPGQEAAVSSTIAGTDTVFIAPTGAGKTAVAIISGLVLMAGVRGPKTTSIVAPIIALCNQHVETINTSVGPDSAIFLWGACSTPELASKVLQQTQPLLICSPEVLANLYASLRNHGVTICAVVVDECHLAFEWGTPDFRPSYTAAFASVRRTHIHGAAMPPMLALTATLRRSDEALLQERLGMDPTETVVIRLPVRRKNVSLHVFLKCSTYC